MLDSARYRLQQITYNKASCDWLKQDYSNLEDELVGLNNKTNSSENALNNYKLLCSY